MNESDVDIALTSTDVDSATRPVALALASAVNGPAGIKIMVRAPEPLGYSGVLSYSPEAGLATTVAGALGEVPYSRTKSYMYLYCYFKP